MFGLNFEKILVLTEEVDSFFEKLKPKQGLHRKLNTLDCVLLYLYFLKNYCTLEKLSVMFEVSTSSCWRYVSLMTDVFERLRCLDNVRIENHKFLLVDGTETEVERPLSNGNFVDYYSRKKMFSVKSQIIVGPLNLKVVSVECCEGSIHDFELFKWTYGSLFIPKSCCLIADAVYEGIKRFHSNSFSILKKPPNSSLDVKSKTFNRCLSNFRVKNEHVIGKLKCWKIFKGLFRHCKFMLDSFYRYACIVASLYNFSLNLS
jgi:hypothetical protein